MLYNLILNDMEQNACSILRLCVVNLAKSTAMKTTHVNNSVVNSYNGEPKTIVKSQFSLS